MARLIGVDRTKLLQEVPIDRPIARASFTSAVLQVDNPVKPRAKQILLTRLPPLACANA